MNMAQVELLTRERAPLLAQPFYQQGDPGPIASALAHVPELMETALPFIDSVFGPTAVEARLKEIVVLRVSSLNRCRYCTETHSRVARRAGLAPDEVAALRGEGPAPGRWTAVERALLAFADALSDRPQEAVAILRPHFGEAEIVELVTLGAATVMLNRFATALELPV
jgi:AhpD family alkylhydroperoxidase